MDFWQRKKARSVMLRCIRVKHNAKCTFCLNRTVHSQQCAMDTVQIIQHLPVHRGQLLVDSHRSVLRRLFAFVCIGAAAAILAFKYFLLPSVFVSLYVLSITEMECLSVRTVHDAVRINMEVLCPIRILPVFPVFAFLVEHPLTAAYRGAGGIRLPSQPRNAAHTGCRRPRRA